MLHGNDEQICTNSDLLAYGGSCPSLLSIGAKNTHTQTPSRMVHAHAAEGTFWSAYGGVPSRVQAGGVREGNKRGVMLQNL